VAEEADLTRSEPVYQFAWSPAGDRFALMDTARRLYVGAAVSRAVRHVGTVQLPSLGAPFPQGNVRGPWWSGDGSVVAWIDEGGTAACLAVADEAEPVISKVKAQRISVSPTGAYLLAYAGSGPGWTGLYRLIDARTGEQIAAFTGAWLPGGDMPAIAQWSHGPDQVAVAVGTYPYGALLVLNGHDGAKRTVEVKQRFTFFRWLPDDTGFVCATPRDGIWAVPLEAAHGESRLLTSALVPHHPPASARFVAACAPSGEPVRLDLSTLEATSFPSVTPAKGQPDSLHVECLSPAGSAMLVTVFRPDPAPPRTSDTDLIARGRQTQTWGHTEVFVCDSEPATRLVLDVEGAGKQPPYLTAHDFAWSPDGRFALFLYSLPPSHTGWAAINIATGQVTVLAEGVSGPVRLIPAPPSGP